MIAPSGGSWSGLAKSMLWSLRLHLVAITAVVMAVTASTGLGQVQVFTDPAAFRAALLTSTTYTFEAADGFAAGPIGTFGDGIVPSATSYVGLSPNYHESTNILWGGAAGLRFDFGDPASALGFRGYTTGQGGFPDAEITFTFDGAPDFKVLLQSVQPSPRGEPFLGIISPKPIQSMVLDNGSPALPPIHFGVAGIDDLTVGSIPEPGLGFFGAAMVGIMLCRRHPRMR